jgi:hypothetical protein
MALTENGNRIKTYDDSLILVNFWKKSSSCYSAYVFVEPHTQKQLRRKHIFSSISALYVYKFIEEQNGKIEFLAKPMLNALSVVSKQLAADYVIEHVTYVTCYSASFLVRSLDYIICIIGYIIGHVQTYMAVWYERRLLGKIGVSCLL